MNVLIVLLWCHCFTESNQRIKKDYIILKLSSKASSSEKLTKYYHSTIIHGLAWINVTLLIWFRYTYGSPIKHSPQASYLGIADGWLARHIIEGLFPTSSKKLPRGLNYPFWIVPLLVAEK